LGVLYPNLVNPIPPMAIAQFDVDPTQGKITNPAHCILPGTSLFSSTPEGFTLRFRTCYPVTLWPLRIVNATLESPAQFDNLPANTTTVLRLRLEVHGTLEELKLDKIRFHISGEQKRVNTLYELLFVHAVGVGVLTEGKKNPILLPEGAIAPIGLAAEDEVIPSPLPSLPAYRFIQEYFTFPQKYHFFEVQHLDQGLKGKKLDILILLDQATQRLTIDHRTFRLGCTPIVNLFRKTTEPVRLDHRQQEYRLDPDVKRPRTTEIHSIVSVSASSNPLTETAQLEPFYSFRHRVDGNPRTAFWHARRVPTCFEDLSGTDLMLSFRDEEFHPSMPPQQTVFAHTYCTNRDFAAQLPAESPLQVEDAAPLSKITCLEPPTWPVYPPLGGATLWHLISNLSLNYLSLSNEAYSLDALRKMLELYSFSDRPSIHHQLQGITKMTCRRVTRRVGNEPWRGFCQGTEITLEFDERLYVGSGAYLLGAVLQEFFTLHAAVNSFTELIMRSQQREGTWKTWRWPPKAGVQPLI
jgi:type VI secretion system protein ImpG